MYTTQTSGILGDKCDDPKAWRKLSQKAKITDTKVVLSLSGFDRILTMRPLGSDTNVLEDLEQIQRVVTEGHKRLMVWLHSMRPHALGMRMMMMMMFGKIMSG